MGIAYPRGRAETLIPLLPMIMPINDAGVRLAAFAGVPVLNAVDCSAWGGELTAQEVTDLRLLGINLLIVGTGNPVPGGAGMYARQQAESWLWGGGLILDAYIYLYLAGDVRQQVRTAVGTLSGLAVRRWWIDAEDISPGCNAMKPSERVFALVTAVSAALDLGLSIGIYSGRWWWEPYVLNTTAFGQYPLWDSYYATGADADHVIIRPWVGREYGGFGEPEIHQFHGTTTLGGQSVDLNWANIDFNTGGIPVDVLQKLVTEREDDLLAAWGAAGEQPLPRAKRIEVATYRRDKAVRGVDDDGTTPFLSLDALIAEHLANHPGGTTTDIPDHRHFGGEVVRVRSGTQ